MKKRKDGRWVKIKTIDGLRIPFYSRAETERAAAKDIENQMLEYQQKAFNKKHNFKELADAALSYRSGSISYNTNETYIHSLKHLSSFFDINIEDISASMLQNLLNDMAVNKNYSFSAISKTKTTFGIILNYAIIREDLDINNFMRSVKIPKNTKKGKIRAPEDAIISKVKENAERAEHGMWAMCLLCTGLRRGELAALQRKDIDFDKNIISINKSVEFIHNQPHVKATPKTEASIGSVPILDILCEPLKELCRDLAPDDYLFGKDRPLSETQIKKKWKKYCSDIGYTIKGHQLRHAYAKLLYQAGIDPKTAQRLLRHSDFSTTMNIYTDFAEEITDKSVGMLNTYLNKKI